jgi:hypothetical protein
MQNKMMNTHAHIDRATTGFSDLSGEPVDRHVSSGILTRASHCALAANAPLEFGHL